MRFSKYLLFALLGISPTLTQAAMISLGASVPSSNPGTSISASTSNFSPSLINGGGTVSGFTSNTLNSTHVLNTTSLNTITTTVSSVIVTITGWTLDPTQGIWQRAPLYVFSSGLGVCSASETSCTSDPQHRVDNNGALEAVLFQFSNSAGTSVQVDVNTVYLSATSSTGDTDASFWARNFTNIAGPNVTLAGLTLAQLQTQWGLNQNLDSIGGGNRAANIPNNFSDTFLLSARVGQSDDYFKIRGLEIFTNSPPTTPGNDPGVPEPSTYATLGAALLALGYYRRKTAK